MRPVHKRVELAMAGGEERERIYQARHSVYAAELGQHHCNPAERLTDPLDEGNVYIVSREEGQIAGFVSITLPTQGRYSIDKYFRRDQLPFEVNNGAYEVRLLTVLREKRGREHAALLMHAAFRWVQAHGGKFIMAIGRREVADMYRHAGLQGTTLSAQSGALIYDLMFAPVAELAAHVEIFRPLLERLERTVDWKLDFSFHAPAPCFHGGAFFEAIGPRFDNLDRRNDIINADVLDAWFPPSPRVVAKLGGSLEWLLRTSPPNSCQGFVHAVAEARGVPPENILPGAGSSDLMFRALPRWLSSSSRALILDPTYGEYAHLLEKVIRCRVDRLLLDRREHYDAPVDRLNELLEQEHDLIVLVNPNSPTGRSVSAATLAALLSRASPATKIWLDETYIDYLRPSESLEQFAARMPNVIVCKSMSKVYALSGARAGYLCASAPLLEELRSITPPWVVSLPAQVAAIEALADADYYRQKYDETRQLRRQLEGDLSSLGLDVVPACANFVLCHLPRGVAATELVKRCRSRGLFIRNAASMSPRFGESAVRIAVKDAETNSRMINILRACL